MQHLNSAHKLNVQNSKLYELNVVDKRKQSSLNFTTSEGSIFVKKKVKEGDVNPSCSTTATETIDAELENQSENLCNTKLSLSEVHNEF